MRSRGCKQKGEKCTGSYFPGIHCLFQELVLSLFSIFFKSTVSLPLHYHNVDSWVCWGPDSHGGSLDPVALISPGCMSMSVSGITHGAPGLRHMPATRGQMASKQANYFDTKLWCSTLTPWGHFGSLLLSLWLRPGLPPARSYKDVKWVMIAMNRPQCSASCPDVVVSHVTLTCMLYGKSGNVLQPSVWVVYQF